MSAKTHILFGLFRETGFHKLYKPFHCLLLIGTACNDANFGVAHNTERENAQKALGIDSSFILFDPN